jgi:hypothetical protein
MLVTILKYTDEFNGTSMRSRDFLIYYISSLIGRPLIYCEIDTIKRQFPTCGKKLATVLQSILEKQDLKKTLKIYFHFLENLRVKNVKGLNPYENLLLNWNTFCNKYEL